MDWEAYLRFCLAKKGAREEHPFGPVPVCVKVEGRIFAEIYPRPTGFAVTLKSEPLLADFYRRRYPDFVRPGYHVPDRGKKYRNTVSFPGVPLEELLTMTDHSYAETVKAFPARVRSLLKEEDGSNRAEEKRGPAETGQRPAKNG